LRNYPVGTASATITLPIETEGWSQPKLNFPKSNRIEIRSEGLAAMILVLVAAAKSSRIAACVDDAAFLDDEMRATGCRANRGFVAASQTERLYTASLVTNLQRFLRRIVIARSPIR
jgi:hypothetical protein